MSGRGAGPGSRRAFARGIAACLFVGLLAAACATTPRRPPPSPDVAVLLPDADGKTGAIVVSAGGSERLLTEPHQAVTVVPGEAPSAPFVMTSEEVHTAVGPALKALPPPPAQLILYFKNDSTELAAESLATLKDVLRTIRERTSTDITVAGHTDTVGSKEYNDRLSLERAKAVAALLAADGVAQANLDVTSHGKSNPLVFTGDQVSEPRNRRVEVTVR